MSTLTERIAADIEAFAAQARDNLTLRAESITRAEQLAQQLCSSGVPAIANGRADGLHILLYVTAGPVDPTRLERALTRLDLRITDTHPGRTDYELRIEGCDFPIYVMAKLEPATC